MITPPLHRSGLRLWGALLLIGLLLTGVVSRVAADFATATVTITAPTQGANLNGAVQLVAQGSTVAAPFEWRDGVFTIQETPSGATAQIRLDQPSGNQWTAQFLPPLAGGDYTVQFHGNLVKTDDGNYSGRAATPVSFHVGQGVANPTAMHRVVNNGNLCGCRSGCAQTRSSTLPRNGDQSWEVPVTSWSYRGWSVPFSLTYHSVGTADPALPAGMDLAHLSERNGKWSHTFAQWVEVVSNGSALKAVWYNGGGTRAFSQVSEGIYNADDSYTDILTGGGVINSPSGQASANQAWFRITDGEGTQYRFEDVQWVTTTNRDFPRYRLKWIIDRWGRKLELAWSGSRLLSVKDTFNRGLTFTYSPADDTGMLTAVSDPALRTHTLTYQSVPDESGTFRKKLTGVTVLGPAMDGQSRPNYVWAFEYGDRSAADGVTAYGGAYTGDLVTRKVEPGGEATNYFYEAVNLASGRPTSGDWDGRVRRMEWNSQGTGLNVTQRIERQGNRLLYPGGESVLYEYSAPQEHPDAHDVKKITDETTGEYVEYAWDDEHNPTAVRTHVEAAQSTWLAQATYTRDPNTDRITRIRTEKARVGTPEVTEVWLNLRNQPLQVVQYADPTNAPLDPTNLVTTFQYDPKDNLTHVHAAPHRTGETLTTVLTYTSATDGHGDNPQPTSVLDPVGNEELAFYHATTGLPIKGRSPANGLATGADANPSETEAGYYADGSLAWALDPTDDETRYSYWSTGLYLNILEYPGYVSGAANAYRQVSLDMAGRPAFTLDENGVRTNYAYVPGGHLSQVTQNALGAAADQLTTLYRYNSRDQLEWIRKPKGAETEQRWIHFDYFERTLANPNSHTGKYLGQVTQISTQTGPSSGGSTPYDREHFGYDAAGRLAWNRKPDGAVIQYSYDEQHRLSRIDYPDNPATSQDSASSVEYEYDQFGRMFRMRDTAGGVPNSTTYSFDGLGRVSAVTHSSLRNGVTYEYERDLPNKRWVTTVTMGGLTWEYRLDPKGRLSGVVNPFGQATSFQYDPDGKVLRQDNGNGTWTLYGYDPAFPGRDWLSSIEHWKTVSGSPQKIAGFTYSRSDNGATDLTGRILKETDHLGQVHSFVYNGLGRLIEEKDPAFGTRKYTYDSHGNITWRRTTKNSNNEDRYFGYDWLDRLTWANNNNSAPGGSPSGYYQKWTYDLAGRPTRRERKLGSGQVKQVHDFHWDTQEKLRAVYAGIDGSASALQWSATYDGAGIRASQTDASGTRVFHTDGDSLLQETGGTAPDTTYTPGFGQRSGSTDRFFHQDWLGSSRYLTDLNGATQSAGVWSAYGKPEGSTGSANETRLRWGGGWGYQSEPEGASNDTGLVLMGQRYYDPEVMRFISPDPIGFAGGLNLYAYCDGDPVGAVDPSGLASDPLGRNGTVRIVLDAFIPTKHADVPQPLGMLYGDNRGYNGNGGTFRFQHALVLDNSTGQATVKHTPGFTRNPWMGGGKTVSTTSMKTSACFRGNGVWDIRLRGNVKDPLTPEFTTPGVTYDLNIRVTPNGTFVSGYNDGYPAFELWRYSNTRAPSMKWGFMPPLSGNQGLRLFDVNPSMRRNFLKAIPRLGGVTTGPAQPKF